MALSPARVIGHKEWAAGRKSDPRHAMSWRRDRVAKFRGRNVGHKVAGAIRAAYDRPILGKTTWAYFLGDPTGPEAPTWDKVGRWQQFAKGIIMWHPTINRGVACVVWGAILTRFWALGAEPVVGYPVSDEASCPDTVGRMSHFKGGQHGDASIYWKPGIGAHPVWGWFRTAWAESGWERGPWGYPTSAESTVDGVVVQSFEGGRVRLEPGGRPVFTPRA